MPACSDLPLRVLNMVKYAASIVLLVAIYAILQHIFDMHFVCSCRYGLHPNGVSYLLFPSLILTFIVCIMEPFYNQDIPFSWQRCGFNCCSGCCCDYLVRFFFKFISLASIWITLVLFDGDWYVCLKTNFNHSQIGLPCKINRTYDEQRYLDAYATESLDFGFYVSCPFLFLWSIIDIQRASWKRCDVRRPRCCFPPYYSVVYENLLAEEVKKHLLEKLTNIAEERAKSICKPHLLEIQQHQARGTYEEPLEVWEKISDAGFFLKRPE